MFKAPRDVAFSCSCGSIKGTLRGVSRSTGTHAVCYCDDCRAAEVFSGQPDPAPGPVALFQTSAHRVSFEQGLDQLAVFSFGKKNVLRWRATCCGSILCNTVRSPKIAFASFKTDVLADRDAIGPVIASAFIPTRNGKRRHKGLSRFVWAAFGRVAAARLTGRWQQTPFFDIDTLQPIRPVQIVDPELRREIKADLA